MSRKRFHGRITGHFRDVCKHHSDGVVFSGGVVIAWFMTWFMVVYDFWWVYQNHLVLPLLYFGLNQEKNHWRELTQQQRNRYSLFKKKYICLYLFFFFYTAAQISTGSQAARSQRRLDRTPPASAKKRPARARPPGNVSAHPMGARGGAGPAAFPVLVLPRSRTASWEWQFRLVYRRRCCACSINNSHHQPHQALFLRENERMQGHQKSSIELVGSMKN